MTTRRFGVAMKLVAKQQHDFRVKAFIREWLGHTSRASLQLLLDVALCQYIQYTSVL